MSFQDFLDEEKDIITDFFVPDEDKILLLKSILEAESNTAVTFEDAEEVGIQLLSLYECLARDRTIVPERRDDKL